MNKIIAILIALLLAWTIGSTTSFWYEYSQCLERNLKTLDESSRPMTDSVFTEATGLMAMPIWWAETLETAIPSCKAETVKGNLLARLLN